MRVVRLIGCGWVGGRGGQAAKRTTSWRADGLKQDGLKPGKSANAVDDVWGALGTDAGGDTPGAALRPTQTSPD
jgi:hypothetical protein